MKRRVLMILIGACVFVSASPAQAAGYYERDIERAPSVINYGFRGFGIGTLLGVSAGYLIARDDHWGSDEWKKMGIGMGVGAIAGSLGGLAVGLYDLSLEKPGVGRIVMRDSLYGSCLGMLVGAVAGALFVIKSDDWEDVALGASIGSLSGAAIGIAIGFIEGPKIVNRYSRDELSQKRYGSIPAWSLGLNVVKDSNKQPAYIPVLTKRF